MRYHRASIELKSMQQFQLMRRAGLVVAAGLRAMRDAAVPGVSTADIDHVGRQVLAEHGASSSFLGYGVPPFPAVICSSRNEMVVHGIPNADDVLSDGDLVSIDFGAIVEGWHGDAAITVEVGEVSAAERAMSAACKASLWDALAQARVGNRLTDISHAVEKSVRSAGSYGIVTGYGGHGIGSEMHMEPHILNHGRPGQGPRLSAGMALAVEPMVTLGSPRTRELSDRWSVVTADGSKSAHWEHTVAILPDGPWVMTEDDGGRKELSARGVLVSEIAAEAFSALG